jgi:hypothetical protein
VIKASGEAINDEDVVSFDPGDRSGCRENAIALLGKTMSEVLTALYQMATVYLVVRAAID